MAGALKTYGMVVLIWSILAAVMSVLFGLNAVVGLMLQPAQPDFSGGANPSYLWGQQVGQVVMYVVVGAFLVWTMFLALLGLRIGPALGRLEPVRRWAIVWCAGNLILCPFGTGIGIWGLVLMLREETRHLLEGGDAGADLPVGIER